MEYQASRPLLLYARWLEFGRVLGGSLPTLLLGQETSRMRRAVNKSVVSMLQMYGMDFLTRTLGSIKHAETFGIPITGIQTD